MKYKIIDNFLTEEEFHRYDVICGGAEGNGSHDMPMYYSGTIGDDKDVSAYYFTHNLYDDMVPKSNFFSDFCFPVLEKLPYLALLRAKINWYPNSHALEEHGAHLDRDDTANYVNALLYCNDNDGFTRFHAENGDSIKIKSKRNRIVLFAGDILHNSTTCTDRKMRVSMNFNVIPKGDWF